MFSWCNHLKSHSVFFWESFFLTALWKVTSVVLQGYFSVTCLLQTHGLTTWDCCYCLPLGSCVLVSDRDRVTRVKRNIPFDFFLTANLAVNIANKRCRTFCLSVHLVVPQWFACCALEWGCERQLPGQVSRWRGIQLCDLLWKLFVHPKKKKKKLHKNMNPKRIMRQAHCTIRQQRLRWSILARCLCVWLAAQLNYPCCSILVFWGPLSHSPFLEELFCGLAGLSWNTCCTNATL